MLLKLVRVQAPPKKIKKKDLTKYKICGIIKTIKGKENPKHQKGIDTMTIQDTVRTDLELLTLCSQLMGKDTAFTRAGFDEIRDGHNRHLTASIYLPSLSTLVDHRIVVKVGEIDTQHEITHENCTVYDRRGRVIEDGVDYTQVVNGIKYLYKVNTNYVGEWLELLTAR